VVIEPVSVVPSTVVSPAVVESPIMVAPTNFVQPASFVQRSSYVQRTRSGSVMGALAIVNQRRATRGLYALSYDPSLAAAAQRKSQNRASRRNSGHDGSSSGARAEGVGFASGGGDLARRFNTCHLYSSGYRSAGAAVAYDGRGAAYFTLLLR
jgi:uncharacterized protein YkwD